MWILAAAGRPAPPNSLVWYLTLIGLGAMILIGIPWAIQVWREARGDLAEECATAEDVLGPLEEAFANGELSREEYLRIRDSAERVVRSELGEGPTGASGPQEAPGDREQG